ncbi:MAG: hypothetical protein WC935_07020 [Thermoleophilia bacterium]
MTTLTPTIVTHRRPHLDEVCALWIIQKYWHEFSHANIEFVTTSPTGGERWNNVAPDSNPFVIYVGVGQGQFDEHKGDVDDSAATLVWRETQARGSISKGEKQAVSRIVEYVKQEDMAQFITNDLHQFGIPTIISGLYGVNKKDSHAVYAVGKQIMEALLFEMLKRISAESDWEGRVDFDTPWGKAAAVVTNIPGIERIAFSKGYVLLVSHNKEGTYHGMRGDPHSNVDLTDVAMRVKQREPEANWFLHQSKRLLLCGGEVAATENYSHLTLAELMDFASK